jgi:hypothetical protein
MFLDVEGSSIIEEKPELIIVKNENIASNAQ